MNRVNNHLRVAAVQAAPVFLDLSASLGKAQNLIAAAAEGGADLVVFPEAFLPGYPDWVWVTPGSNKNELDQLYTALWENSVSIPSPATGALCRAARTHRTYVAMGINERNTEQSSYSLYNTLLFIGPDGEILGCHRKLIPTGAERMVWARGDGSTLRVYDTARVRLGGLICWENYMPLARQGLYIQGLQVLLAPTWDSSDVWLATMQHIAKEGGVYVIGCCQALHRDMIPDRWPFKDRYAADKHWINRGNSCVVDPRGRFRAGPVVEQETILFADLDLARIPAVRWVLDVAGHYARPDVFEFRVRPVATLAADEPLTERNLTPELAESDEPSDF